MQKKWEATAAKGMALTGGHSPAGNAFNDVSRQDKRDLYMDGRAIFSFANKNSSKISKEPYGKADVTVDDLDFVLRIRLTAE